jgi:glycosyltransferase involved in cell wall biosynthesis
VTSGKVFCFIFQGAVVFKEVILDKKLFSIIIPAFNYAGLLGRAISSVLTQSGDDFELIIVDDGSTDTEKVVDAWREK